MDDPGSVNQNVAPWSTAAFAQASPPWRGATEPGRAYHFIRSP